MTATTLARKSLGNQKFTNYSKTFQSGSISTGTLAGSLQQLLLSSCSLAAFESLEHSQNFKSSFSLESLHLHWMFTGFLQDSRRNLTKSLAGFLRDFRRILELNSEKPSSLLNQSRTTSPKAISSLLYSNTCKLAKRPKNFQRSLLSEAISPWKSATRRSRRFREIL